MTESYSQLPEKPRPQIAPGNQAYWDGLREHRLLIQRCTGCAKLRHYPRPMCDSCYAMTYDWCEVEKRGTVHSWTVTHHPFHPGFKQDLPYITVTADLSVGVRLQAPLLGDGGAALALGLAMVVEFADVDASLTLPCLRLAD